MPIKRLNSLGLLIGFTLSGVFASGCSHHSSDSFIPFPGHKVPLSRVSGGQAAIQNLPTNTTQLPQTLRLPEYWMSSSEIEVQSFAEFLNAHPELKGPYLDQVRLCFGRFRPLPGFKHRPVTGVSLDDAEAFCIWLSETTGRRCRLPSPTEWTHMANQGKSGRPYPWGWDSPDRRAVYNCEGPRQVGFFGSTDGGWRDVAGNVYEWSVDPATRQAFVHGGAWSDHHPDSLSILNTFEQPPVHRSPDIGFRILVEP